MKGTHAAESPPHPDRGLTTGAPRWVKVFGVVGFVLILLVVGVRLSGGGGSHGPGRHTSPASATDGPEGSGTG